MRRPISEEPSKPVEPIMPSTPPPAEGGTTFVAMRHRNYQLYFGGQLISNIGTWMQVIAQGWVVYQLGHSELTLGLVAFASAIPTLIISPWGGVVVDRVSRRNLLMMTQAGAMLLAFALALLTFANVVKEWHVIVLAALLGVVNAFDAPARQAFVPEMVGKRDLPNAIALNSMMFNSARVIGPAIAGLMLAAIGAAWCFTLNGISYFAVLAGLWWMKLPPHRSTQHTTSPWQQMVSGVKYAAGYREISALILLSLVFSIFGVSYFTILPAFVEKILNQGAIAYGWVNAASGLGAITGALVLASPLSNGKRGRILVITNLIFPILLIAFSFVRIYWLSLVLAYGLGVGFMTQFTTINTLLQTRVDDAFRGRVMGLYTLTFFGFAPFGNLMIGALGEKMGLSFAMTLFACLSLILSRVVLTKTPEVQSLA
ncbi:MAG TPA: MFS transporter [Anaerolineales bacterium]|nr:MFS transporter [Anaerolineales bacterium]HMZ06449.1 MFS transporter [Anaerolineales bacterium]HNC90348.1 MFS transporter [Anaerolineales bacterium]HND93164.1 MFS transporter [Anaerolineales bacterium]HNF36566.1 MFS transporter [Anaerolineales bacterium]